MPSHILENTTSPTCGTFCSFFAVHPTTFVGNLGVSLEIDFPKKAVPFNAELNLNEGLNVNENKENENEEEQRIQCYQTKEEQLIEHYTEKKNELVRKYEAFIFKVAVMHQSESNKLKMKTEIAKLFSSFHAELNNLRREFDCQSDTVYDKYFMQKYNNNMGNYLTIDANMFLEDL